MSTRASGALRAHLALFVPESGRDSSAHPGTPPILLRAQRLSFDARNAILLMIDTPRGRRRGDMEMISDDLLRILACPACKTRVELVKETWLVCTNDDCRRKYPIRDGIPIMLIEEGDKYVDTSVDDLGTP
jgi:hypothetical protein